jgi:hypothetical protein
MDAEGGGRGKNLPSAGGGQPVAQILVETDPKKLNSEAGRSKIIGLRIAHKR